jgi:hypothetical protein
MDINNIVKLAYTHPDNHAKSIRQIARQLDINPGTFYRILKRLGLVENPQRQHPVDPEPPRFSSDFTSCDQCPNRPEPTPPLSNRYRALYRATTSPK